MPVSEFEIVSVDDARIYVREVRSGHEFAFRVYLFEDGRRALAAQTEFVPSSFTNLDPCPIRQKARSYSERELLRSGLIVSRPEGSTERGDVGGGSGRP